MLSHCEDAASDTSLLTDDDALKNCRPILLNAIRDASQLPNPDDILLVLIRLIWLLPSRGCNPNSHSTAPLIEAINNLFTITISADTLRNSAVGRFLDTYKQESIGRCLFAATYRRHLLSAYRESLRNAGFPQLIPPVVQMCRDLAEAHREPSKASPALQSLRHRLNVSAINQFDSESSHHDPSLFSNVSKLISMSGIGVGRRTPQPYSPNFIILVVYGTMTWGLAREIVDAVTRNSPEPLEVLIICNYLLRGHDIFQQCLL
nr:retrovirus Pol polyprotein from type 1 [Hymenolepis microstoma]